MKVCSVNVGTLRGKPGKIVEMLKHRPVDICCAQETRFRGESVQMISGKSAEYMLFWIGNEKHSGEVGIFLAIKWVDRIIDVSRLSNGIIVNKVLVHTIFISVISVYAHNMVYMMARKMISMTSLISVVRKLREKEIAVIGNTLFQKRASQLVT